LYGEGNAAPVLRSVGRFGVGSGLPAYSASFGLGSNVSTRAAAAEENVDDVLAVGAARCLGAAARHSWYAQMVPQPGLLHRSAAAAASSAAAGRDTEAVIGVNQPKAEAESGRD
jgi:hypothetical protein